MSDRLTSPLKTYYCDDPEALAELITQLLRTFAWFDVRIPAKHCYQISFNADHTTEIPKKLAAKLIEPQPMNLTGTQDPRQKLSSYRAERRKKLGKGKR
jgi:hypothetical protein